MARTLISRRASLLFLNFFCEVVEGGVTGTGVRGFVVQKGFPGRLCVESVDLLPKTLRPLSTIALRRVDFCLGAIQ